MFPRADDPPDVDQLAPPAGGELPEFDARRGSVTTEYAERAGRCRYGRGPSGKLGVRDHERQNQPGDNGEPGCSHRPGDDDDRMFHGGLCSVALADRLLWDLGNIRPVRILGAPVVNLAGVS